MQLGMGEFCGSNTAEDGRGEEALVDAVVRETAAETQRKNAGDCTASHKPTRKLLLLSCCCGGKLSTTKCVV